MIRRSRFSRPTVSESRAPLRALDGARKAPPLTGQRAVLLSEFLAVWQRCLRSEGLYTLLLQGEPHELAITVDERELAYLLTQYGAILTRMHKTRQLSASTRGSSDLFAMLRLAVLRAARALQSERLTERRRLVESSLGYLGVRLAYDESPLEVGSICMIPAVSAAAVRELGAVDASGIARAVTDALRDIRPYLSGEEKAK